MWHADEDKHPFGEQIVGVSLSQTGAFSAVEVQQRDASTGALEPRLYRVSDDGVTYSLVAAAKIDGVFESDLLLRSSTPQGKQVLSRYDGDAITQLLGPSAEIRWLAGTSERDIWCAYDGDAITILSLGKTSWLQELNTSSLGCYGVTALFDDQQTAWISHRECETCSWSYREEEISRGESIGIGPLRSSARVLDHLYFDSPSSTSTQLLVRSP